MAGVSKKKTWSSPDGACTTCRARKIKCGREKPQCSSCCRDRHECIYSSPPKRVNHIKVLCQSFDEIQDRLNVIQGDLSRLTATLGKPNPTEPMADFAGNESLPPPPPPPPSVGHVVRDLDSQIERYHGPWTLLAQCRQFEADLAAWLAADRAAEVGMLLTRMVHDTMRVTDATSYSECLSAGMPDMKMCLPPRQLLSVMVECFLKNADHATNIFDPQSLYQAVDRVYQDPSGPGVKLWVLCFNLIILLTLGAEHSLQSEDPFVRPMLQAVHVTAGDSRLFMEPRPVSVQALALYSLLAQQCYTDNEALGDSIFAQACILACQMGLPQTHSHGVSSSALTPAEVDERHRVYQSLYIRDRYSTTASGGLAWLPNGVASTSNVGAFAAHWELAKLQDEVHRVLGAPDVAPPDRAVAVARLREKLRAWQDTYRVPSTTQPMTVDRVVLLLGLLGTRMYISMESKETRTEEALDDSRLSCLLLMVSCTPQQSPAFRHQLHALLNKSSSSREKADSSSGSSRSSTPSPSSSSSSSSASSSPTPRSTDDGPRRPTTAAEPSSNTNPPMNSSSPPLVPLHRLAKVFPITAIFILARHILGVGVTPGGTPPSAIGPDQHPNSDILLLESLLSCFQNNPPFLGTNDRNNSRSYKLGQTLEHLVTIIHTLTSHPTTTTAAKDEVPKTPSDHMETDPDEYLSRFLMASTGSPTAIDMSNIWYSMGMAGSPSMDISISGFQSAWPTPRDSMGSSSTPLLIAGSSLPTSLMHSTPIMPNTPLDLSRLFGPTESDGREAWEVERGAAEEVNQVQQCGLSRKRQRHDTETED